MIVNISSGVASVPSPMYTMYCASKASTELLSLSKHRMIGQLYTMLLELVVCITNNQSDFNVSVLLSLYRFLWRGSLKVCRLNIKLKES